MQDAIKAINAYAAKAASNTKSKKRLALIERSRVVACDCIGWMAEFADLPTVQ